MSALTNLVNDPIKKLFDEKCSNEFKKQYNGNSFGTVSRLDTDIDSSKHISPEDTFHIFWEADRRNL